MVAVTLKGKGELVSIKIDPSLMQDEAEIVEHVFEYNKNSYEDIREMEKMCTNVAGANNDEGDDSTKHPLDAEFHPWQFEKYEHAYA